MTNATAVHWVAFVLLLKPCMAMKTAIATVQPAQVQNMRKRRPRRSIKNGVGQVPIQKTVLLTAARTDWRVTDSPTLAKIMVLK
jgi:hypothetical protein